MAREPKTVLTVRSSDFRADGRHARMDVLYRHWFEFLRLSPSYQLAHRVRTGERLTAADKKRLPADFDRVLKVYDDFGDVQRAFFRFWWLQRGLKLMGSPGEAPTVQMVAKFNASSEDPTSLVDNLFEQHVRGAWVKQARPDSMVIAIPLTAQRTKILSAVRKLLAEHLLAPKAASKAKYKLEKKKTHLRSLEIALRALWTRALKPDWDLWRIGAETKISPTYSKEVDPFAKRKAKNTIAARQMLTIMTSRALLNGLMIAENAARGIFPSNAKCTNAVKFDPEEFHKILKASSAWHKAEKAKPATKAK
jgi:hypothetical protein